MREDNKNEERKEREEGRKKIDYKILTNTFLKLQILFVFLSENEVILVATA